MASEWPAFAELSESFDEPYAAEEAGLFVSRGGLNWDGPIWNPDCEYNEAVYLHRDAARAWQAFRDWLNGTADQWRGAVSRAWLSGRDYGREDVR